MSLIPVYVSICEYLHQNNLGNIGYGIFGGEWGDEDAQILVLSGGGTVAAPKTQYLNVEIQFIVRGNKRQSDREVYEVAKRVYNLMILTPDQIDIDGVCFTGFEPITNLASLGKDDNERFMYTMNFSTYTNPT
mgnify:CR=1 FL=1